MNLNLFIDNYAPMFKICDYFLDCPTLFAFSYLQSGVFVLSLKAIGVYCGQKKKSKD